MSWLSASAPVAAQGVAVAAALAALTMWPPTTGRMLLVPLAGFDADALAGSAVAAGASLLGTGPMPGSLVVIGDRSAIARRVGSWRVAILAAPPAGCGGAPGGRPS